MDFSLSREHQDLQERVALLVRHKIAPRAKKYDMDGSFPKENFSDLHQAGLLGMLIPCSYGGLGVDFLTYTTVIREIAKGCGSTALIYAMHCGATYVVGQSGTEQQKGNYLRSVTEDGNLFSWAFSEPGIGGNILKPQLNVEETDSGYILDGKKSFCTAAGHATYYLINAPTPEASFMKSQNLFIVDALKHPIEVQHSWDSLGMRANNSHTVIFNQCTVEDSACLGRDQQGMSALLQGIPPLTLGLAAASLGVSMAAYEFALQHVSSRVIQTNNKTLTTYQAVRFMLSEMYMKIHTAQLALQNAAWLAEQEPLSAFMYVNIAKFLCNQTAIEVAATAMQVCGGQAYLKKNPLERYFRDSRAGSVMGANLEVLRDMIAKSLLGLDPRQN